MSCSFSGEAVRLKELPYVFTGGLPKEETDETRIPVNGTNQDELEDPLCDGESTKVLTLLIGRPGVDCHVLQLYPSLNISRKRFQEPGFHAFGFG